MKKVTAEEINGVYTVKNATEEKMDKVFNMTRFNWGVHEEEQPDGTFTVTFVCMFDAAKFAEFYNEI